MTYSPNHAQMNEKLFSLQLKSSKLVAVLLFLVSINMANAQWVPFRNAPELLSGARYDNLAFTDSLHGSVVGPSGQIHTTFDGGYTWETTLLINNYHRSICYQSRDTGFVGGLDGRLFHTINGGVEWVDISDRIPKQMPVICGLVAYKDCIFGIGNFAGPADFFKSENRGSTWTHINLDSLLYGAVDVYFFNEQLGIVSGIGLSKPDDIGSLGTLILTEDGGDTWRVIAESTIPNSYIWKLDITPEGRIFGSLQTFTGEVPAYIFANGLDDTFHTVTLEDEFNRAFDAQAIGFLNEERGWLTGWGIGHFETLDGGETWQRQEGTSQVNRLFRLNDHIMLGAGSEVFAFNETSTSITDFDSNKDNWPHQITEIYPNPVAEQLNVSLSLDAHTLVMIDAFTANGRHVDHYFKKVLPTGQHNLSFNTRQLSNGQYILVVRTYERHMSQIFQVVR